MPSILDKIGLKTQTDKSSKGHDYLRHYEMFFAPSRVEAFTLIEIGGLNGASLKMWHEYFPKAQIVCIDVKEAVKRFEGDRIAVEVGNAGDPQFLRQVRNKYKQARIVLDDGSHRWDHQRVAFSELFGIVEPGGYYVVEDLHTSFEAGFAGTDFVPFIEVMKELVDYLNCRGDARRRFESLHHRRLVKIARQIDFACFVPRSCLVRKKAPRLTPVRSN